MAPLTLKASTLIESIIAMTVLAIVFSISMMTIGWGLRAGNTAPLIAADIALKTAIAETKKQNRFFDETLEREQFIIKKTTLLREGNAHLVQVNFEVFSKEEQLLKSQQILVYVP